MEACGFKFSNGSFCSRPAEQCADHRAQRTTLPDGTGCTYLPDGSGFFVGSLPLPKDHWLTADGHNEPPMPLQMGVDDPERKRLTVGVVAAARYAIRGATMNGTLMDFDPDALVQNLIVGLFGYHTHNGLNTEQGGRLKNKAEPR